MQISVTAVCTCASPSISDILRCWSPSCAWGHSALLFPPTLTSASRDGKVPFFFFFFFSLVFSFLYPHPPRPSLALSVARLQRCKSMHHFSPAFRFDIDKGGCYGTASPLVRWLELHWCPTALFSSSERGAAGMDLQDKCSCVCVSESSGTKRPFQSADGMEKVSIMQTSNQSKTKARMQNILTLWSWNCGWFFCHTGNTADRTGPVLRIRRFKMMDKICCRFCLL